MARSFYHDFTRDDGTVVEVRWSWDETEGARALEAYDYSIDVDTQVELTDEEHERFHEEMVALKPFPPYEQDCTGL